MSNMLHCIWYSNVSTRFSIIDLHVGYCYAVIHLFELAGKPYFLIQPTYSELIGLLIYKIPYYCYTNSEIQQYKNKTTKLLTDKIRNPMCTVKPSSK